MADSPWKPVEENTSAWKPVQEVVPGTEKLGGQPPAAGAKPAPPLPLQGKPLGVGARALQNLPGSALNAAENFTKGFGPPAGSVDISNDKGPTLLESAGNSIKALAHPSEMFANDPIGTGALARGAFKGGAGLIRHAPEIEAAAGGAAKGAAAGVRPLLTKFAPITHPLKTLPDLWDFGKGIYQGAKEGLANLSETRANTPTVRPRVPLSRQIERGMPLDQPPDASRVTVTTGEPLSYPGPRQLGPGAPAPKPLTPPAPVETGEPMSHAGIVSKLQQNVGNAGSQAEFDTARREQADYERTSPQPLGSVPTHLLKKPKALAAAQALSNALSR